MRHSKSGFSLVEVLVSVGVIAAALTAVVGVFIVSRESAFMAYKKQEAMVLSNQYIEYIKNIKRGDWDLMMITGTYIIVQNNSDIVFQAISNPVTDAEVINGYSRYIEIEDVFRNPNGDIVDSSDPQALNDPSSKTVSVTISWAGFKPGTITQSVMMTRYLDSLSWRDTTYADFTDDTGNDYDANHSGTINVDTEGGAYSGEVMLGAGGSGDWCDPVNISPKNLDGQGVANAVTAIEGRAFVGTGENASGLSFLNIGIGQSDPPDITVLGQSNQGKTNDVFGEANYGYIATDTNDKEVSIIDLSTYNIISSFDIKQNTFPVNTDGLSVFVSGNVGYVTSAENHLYSFNVTNKTTNPLPILDPDGLALSGTGNSVYVVGGYAYVAESGSRQLEIVNVSNPESMFVEGYVELNSYGFGTPKGATDVYVNQSGTRAYVVTENSSLQDEREFFIIDVADSKSGSRPVLGSYDSGSMSPNGVEVATGGRAILVGIGGEEYQVINISNESNPARCGGMELNLGIYDSASVLETDNDAFTYIVTGDANGEFQIIEGGPGGAFATSGIFTSRVFDSGFNSTGYNRFEVVFNRPIRTDITFQVAVVEPGPSGTCSDANFSPFSFVGPGGSTIDHFTGSGEVPTGQYGSNYKNPAQCFRYRAFLSTEEPANTPMLYDFIVNYSP